jgi:hypothetical protein
MRLATMAVLLLVACGEEPLPAQTGLVFVTGDARLTPACTPTQRSTLYTGSAVEPMLAADPRDPLHFCAVWQQDRFSDHGAAAVLSSCSFDGGHTWLPSAPPAFTRCTGGAFERGSDPWISIAPDGTVHWIVLAFDESDAAQAMLASRSTDGGRSWSAPVALTTEISAAIDKETITADPKDARFVYAVWDRLDQASSTGLTWFTRSTDGGLSWEPARPIFDPGVNAQTVGNQIVVLPGGRLANIFTQLNGPVAAVALLSDDRGRTWSAPVLIGFQASKGVIDVKDGQPVRSGVSVPSVAADASTGELYAAWEDAHFAGHDGVVLSRSSDGGVTWSAPVAVNGRLDVQAFTPVVSAAGGVVAVSYFDTRDDIGEPDRLRVAHWLARSIDGGATFTDERLSQPFDLQLAPEETLPGEDGFFLGDYMGLAAAGGRFLPLFIVTGAENRSDVVFRP